MILNLSSNFAPILGKEIKYETFVFSGGEPHIRLQSMANDEEVTITHRVNSFNDLGLLHVAVDALRRTHKGDVNLFLPYFPGARQDRVMVEGESLTVKVYADLINQLQFNSVIILDPHSDVTPALLNNCEIITNHAFINLVVHELPSDYILIAPDSGAAKKVFHLAKYLNQKHILECSKTRNVHNGQLSGFTVPHNNLENKPCLIVDDICDGGGTFIGLAKELKSKHAGPLYLAISHGIFSKGYDQLLKYFDKIFTTDSISNIQEKNIIQIPLLKTIN